MKEWIVVFEDGRQTVVFANDILRAIHELPDFTEVVSITLRK